MVLKVDSLLKSMDGSKVHYTTFFSFFHLLVTSHLASLLSQLLLLGSLLDCDLGQSLRGEVLAISIGGIHTKLKRVPIWHRQFLATLLA